MMLLLVLMVYHWTNINSYGNIADAINFGF